MLGEAAGVYRQNVPPSLSLLDEAIFFFSKHKTLGNMVQTLPVFLTRVGSENTEGEE